MQIKTPMKCHFTHIKMTIIIRKKKHTEIISVDKAVEKLELLCIRGCNINGTVAVENSNAVPQKIKHFCII